MSRSISVTTLGALKGVLVSMSGCVNAVGAVVLAALVIGMTTTTASADGQAPTCLGAEATIVGTGGNDVLEGHVRDLM